MPAYNKRFC